MILPFLAIFLSGLFQSIYAWRTFFLVYSGEDSVEIARAKGLPPRMMERRYILRPGLPTVLTSFSLLLIVLWQEIIAPESYFNVAGIGRLFRVALYTFDIPVILGLVVTFAYLLAITVFFLDIFYAIVDPRVRIGGAGQTAESAFQRRRWAGLASLRTWFQRTPRRTPERARTPRAKAAPRSTRAAFAGWLTGLRERVTSLGSVLGELVRYGPAGIGLVIIAALVAMSIIAVIAIPYKEVMRLWYNTEGIWDRTPKNAAPEWVNFLRKEDLPPTIILDTRAGAPSDPGLVTKTATAVSEEMTDITLSFSFNYPYGAYPQDMALYVDLKTERKMAQVSLDWLTPDGREISLGTYSTRSALTYYPDQDDHLRRKVRPTPPLQALFANPSSSEGPLKGRYELRVKGLFFDQAVDLDAEFVLWGRAYGWMGTDGNGRDLILPFLWGAPVALSFGLLAAVGTSFSTMLIAGAGVWFGGWVDGLVQRVTEVNMILPFLPVSIMIYTLYSNSFWVVMGVTVLLSIFGSAIKNYRAIFLQLKEAPYIEAARSCGAGDWRIIFRYLVPRISTVLIPQIVVLIPGFIFLEATLTFLGVGVSSPPTWGKLVVHLLGRSPYEGGIALVLVPLGLLLLTGFAFAMLGMALERFFEPRLKDR
jgi:peptide/nickel transport system permease protein